MIFQQEDVVNQQCIPVYKSYFVSSEKFFDLISANSLVLYLDC